MAAAQRKGKQRTRSDRELLNEIARSMAEIRTAMYGINGAGGFVREVAGKLETQEREIERLRLFLRHDYTANSWVLVNRLNEILERLAQHEGAAPMEPQAAAARLRPLGFKRDKDDKERLQITLEE
jgi:hypothetical protein